MVGPCIRGSIVGECVEFNGQRVGGKHAARACGTITDLGTIDRQGAGTKVGNLLQDKANAICSVVAPSQVHVKFKLKWRVQMKGTLMPSCPLYVIDVGGELNAIRTTWEGVPDKTPLSPRRKRSRKNQETEGDEETHQRVRGCG